MADVFISYSSKDLELARSIRAVLEAAGISCWIADDDILPSEIYGNAIISAINQSRLVILIFTSHANESNHVLSEIDRAFNRKKPIILLRVQNIALSQPLEYYLSTGSWLNASAPPIDQHLPKLLEKVKRLLDKTSPVAGGAEMPDGRERPDSEANRQPRHAYREPPTKTALEARYGSRSVKGQPALNIRGRISRYIGLAVVLFGLMIVILLLYRYGQDSRLNRTPEVIRANAPISNTAIVDGQAAVNRSIADSKSANPLLDKASNLGKTIGLDKNPKDPDLHHKLAEMLEAEGDIDGAIAEYRRATQLPPKRIPSAFLYRDLGRALEKKGDLDGALAAMQQSVRRWPKKNRLYCSGAEETGLVRLLEKKGSIDQAIEFYRPLVERHPNNSTCREIYERLQSYK